MSAKARALVTARPHLLLAHLWLGLPLLAGLVGGLTLAIPLSDTWWHLRLGQIILSTGSLPSVDTLSFTASGHYYPALEWLGEVYLYGLYSIGGLELVITINAILLSLTAWLSVRSARLLGAGPRATGLIMLAFVVICLLPVRDTRPQVLGFVAFAFWRYLLAKQQAGFSSPLWLVLPMAALWTNANGTVVIGAGLLGLSWLGGAVQSRLGGRLGPAVPGQWQRQQFLAAACVPLAMLANPWGVYLFRYIYDFMRDPYARRVITEWQPPNPNEPGGQVFLALFVLSVIVIALAPRRLTLTEGLLFCAFSALALQSHRNVVWFGLAIGPVVAAQAQSLAALWRGPMDQGEKPRLNWAIASLAIAVVLINLPWARAYWPTTTGERYLYDAETPVATIEYAAGHYSGARFFHPYSYGSYMLWVARDRLPVFIDGRYNHYVGQILEDYGAVINADDWEERLGRYGITHAIIAKHFGEAESMKPLLKALRQATTWQVVYEDELAVIFVMMEG
ncbi:MAG: hypothetical protein ACYC4L_13980 [Chloroflexota bacterium]